MVHQKKAHKSLVTCFQRRPWSIETFSNFQYGPGSNSLTPLIDQGEESGEMDSMLHQPGFSSADPDPPTRSASLPSHHTTPAQNQLSPPLTLDSTIPNGQGTDDASLGAGDNTDPASAEGDVR